MYRLIRNQDNTARHWSYSCTVSSEIRTTRQGIGATHVPSHQRSGQHGKALELLMYRLIRDQDNTARHWSYSCTVSSEIRTTRRGIGATHVPSHQRSGQHGEALELLMYHLIRDQDNTARHWSYSCTVSSEIRTTRRGIGATRVPSHQRSGQHGEASELVMYRLIRDQDNTARHRSYSCTVSSEIRTTRRGIGATRVPSHQRSGQHGEALELVMYRLIRDQDNTARHRSYSCTVSSEIRTTRRGIGAGHVPSHQRSGQHGEALELLVYRLIRDQDNTARHRSYSCTVSSEIRTTRRGIRAGHVPSHQRSGQHGEASELLMYRLIRDRDNTARHQSWSCTVSSEIRTTRRGIGATHVPSHQRSGQHGEALELLVYRLIRDQDNTARHWSYSCTVSSEIRTTRRGIGATRVPSHQRSGQHGEASELLVYHLIRDQDNTARHRSYSCTVSSEIRTTRRGIGATHVPSHQRSGQHGEALELLMYRLIRDQDNTARHRSYSCTVSSEIRTTRRGIGATHGSGQHGEASELLIRTTRRGIRAGHELLMYRLIRDQDNTARHRSYSCTVSSEIRTTRRGIGATRVPSHQRSGQHGEASELVMYRLIRDQDNTARHRSYSCTVSSEIRTTRRGIELLMYCRDQDNTARHHSCTVSSEIRTTRRGIGATRVPSHQRSGQHGEASEIRTTRRGIGATRVPSHQRSGQHGEASELLVYRLIRDQDNTARHQSWSCTVSSEIRTTRRGIGATRVPSHQRSGQHGEALELLMYHLIRDQDNTARHRSYSCTVSSEIRTTRRGIGATHVPSHQRSGQHGEASELLVYRLIRDQDNTARHRSYSCTVSSEIRTTRRGIGATHVYRLIRDQDNTARHRRSSSEIIGATHVPSHQRSGQHGEASELLVYRLIRDHNVQSCFPNIEIILCVYLCIMVTNCMGGGGVIFSNLEA